MKLWLTAAEIAEAGLPGLPETRRGVHAFALRADWAAHARLVRERNGRGGGMEYHALVLPGPARAAWFGRQLDSMPAAAAAAVLAEPDLSGSTVDGAAIQRDARLAVLGAYRAFLDRSGLRPTQAIPLFVDMVRAGAAPLPGWVRERVGSLSERSLARWIAARRAGALERLAVDRGAHRRGSGAFERADVRAFTLGLLAKQPMLSAWHVARIVADEFPTLPPVSIRTVQGALKRLRSDAHVPLTAITNPDAYRSRYRFAGRHSHPTSRPNELWMIDASPADVLCVDGRHSVYVAIDVHTRRVIVYVSPTPRASAVGLLMRRAILAWGVPERLKTDNGSDFTARETQRLMAALEIEVELARAFAPEQKGHVERAIGTFQRDAMTLVEGFIGHNVADRKAIEARKSFAARLGESPEGMVAASQTAAQLQAWCDTWAAEVYAHRPHAGLGGRTPFAAAAGHAGRIPDPRALDVLLHPAAGGDGIRTVTRQGVRVDGATYLTPQVMPGTRVLVRMDPVDMGRVTLFDEAGTRFLAQAVCPELAGLDPVAAAAEAKRLQREFIAAHTAPILVEARKIKPGRMREAVARQMAKAAGTLVEFPARPLPFSTPQTAAALDSERDSVPQAERLSEAQQRLQAEIEAELAPKPLPAATANVRPIRSTETEHQRFRRWLDLSARHAAGEPLEAAQLMWLGSYGGSAECKGLNAMFEEFGEVALR